MIDSYISVSQLNTHIKNIFDAEIMLQNICVYGEVSSYNVSNNIAYFNLKDEGGMLACVLFGANTFDAPKIGDVVLIRGSMNYYAKGGKLSFNAVSIMPYGRGVLYEKFLKLKADLEARGYFDSAIKQQIPSKVRRIGVVSSATGAVIRDIIDVTHRRNDSIDIVLYPVKVQGIGAEREIASGIEFFSNYDNVDVIIVARGGGSMEDLEPFNTEIVANAVFNCKKPLVSAVGHETDFTIIDFVSDLRAPTPSAAAELVAWDKSLEVETIISTIRRIENLFINKVAENSKEVESLIKNINNAIENKIIQCNNSIEKLILKMNSIDLLVERQQSKLDRLFVQLEGFNPKKISQMGYSKILRDGKVVKSVAGIEHGDILNVSMIDGKLDCSVL